MWPEHGRRKGPRKGRARRSCGVGKQGCREETSGAASGAWVRVSGAAAKARLCRRRPRHKSLRAASRLRARTKSPIASGLRQSTKFVDQQQRKPVSVEAASVSTGESGVSAERAVVAAGCKLWTWSCARRWRSRTNGGPGDNPAQRAQVSSSAHAPSISVGRRSRRARQRRGQRGAAPYGDRVLVYASRFLSEEYP